MSIIVFNKYGPVGLRKEVKYIIQYLDFLFVKLKTTITSDKTGIPVVTLPFTVGGSPEATDLYKVYDASIQLLSQ